MKKEHHQRLQAYVDLLLTWNKRINLIGRTTESDIWHRHIEDSMQLLRHLPQNTRVVTDIGSGAGLPGVVLALCGIEEVHVVESNQKKAAFLREAARLVPGTLHVHAKRIEHISPWEGDVLTARALAPMIQLLPLAEELLQRHRLFLCLKGANIVEEMKEASVLWEIEWEQFSSVTEEHATILAIQQARRRV